MSEEKQLTVDQVNYKKPLDACTVAKQSKEEERYKDEMADLEDLEDER